MFNGIIIVLCDKIATYIRKVSHWLTLLPEAQVHDDIASLQNKTKKITESKDTFVSGSEVHFQKAKRVGRSWRIVTEFH